MFSKIIRFFDTLRRFWNETYSEVFKKAIWPKPREWVQYTVVVCVAVIVLTCVIFLFDFSLMNLIQFFTRLVSA